jgi:hypothetical protein
MAKFHAIIIGQPASMSTLPSNLKSGEYGKRDVMVPGDR